MSVRPSLTLSILCSNSVMHHQNKIFSFTLLSHNLLNLNLGFCLKWRLFIFKDFLKIFSLREEKCEHMMENLLIISWKFLPDWKNIHYVLFSFLISKIISFFLFVCVFLCLFLCLFFCITLFLFYGQFVLVFCSSGKNY